MNAMSTINGLIMYLNACIYVLTMEYNSSSHKLVKLMHILIRTCTTVDGHIPTPLASLFKNLTLTNKRNSKIYDSKPYDCVNPLLVNI